MTKQVELHKEDIEELNDRFEIGDFPPAEHVYNDEFK